MTELTAIQKKRTYLTKRKKEQNSHFPKKIKVLKY